MKFGRTATLGEIAALLGGRIMGAEPSLEITGISGLEEAVGGDIAFLAEKRLLKAAASSGASAIMVKEFVPGLSAAQLVVADPHLCLIALLERFFPAPHRPEGISPLAHLSEGVQTGDGVAIGAFAFVGQGATIGKGTAVYPGVFIGEGASLGQDCIVYPNAVIRERVRLGDRVIIHAGAVIGADGFGYIQRQGRHLKIPQVGGVSIGDDVEVGANAAIDRATTGETVIGRGTKIDNLVQIGHNVSVGEDAVIVAQAGIAGSSRVGNAVVLAGQAGVADHASIEDGAVVGAQAGVMGRLPKGMYSGSPAMPHREWLRAASLFGRLPELAKRIKAIEEKLGLAGGPAGPEGGGDD